MTLGPPRRFVPICVRHPYGFIGGPSGYVESETATAPIITAPIIVEHKMPEPLYSVGTWDTDAQAYTPQAGLEKSFNLTLAELRNAMRQLRLMGYSVHRRRDAYGTRDDNDTSVLVERTDGMTENDIMEGWKR